MASSLYDPVISVWKFIRDGSLTAAVTSIVAFLVAARVLSPEDGQTATEGAAVAVEGVGMMVAGVGGLAGVLMGLIAALRNYWKHKDKPQLTFLLLAAALMIPLTGCLNAGALPSIGGKLKYSANYTENYSDEFGNPQSVSFENKIEAPAGVDVAGLATFHGKWSETEDTISVSADPVASTQGQAALMAELGALNAQILPGIIESVTKAVLEGFLASLAPQPDGGNPLAEALLNSLTSPRP